MKVDIFSGENINTISFCNMYLPYVALLLLAYWSFARLP